MFDVASGQLHAVSPAIAATLAGAIEAADPLRADLIASAMGLLSPTPAARPRPASVPTTAISLAIAQKCNLGCTYCYAQQGRFGGKPKDMPEAVARASVDQVLGAALPGEPVTVAFMGGEPLSNRRALHEVTHYAARQAALRKIPLRFGLTTNATMLTDEDIALFQRYAFTLTVSIDGLGTAHDALRPFAGGRGSFAHVEANVRRLVDTTKRRYRLLARATLTAANMDLPTTLLGLVAMGFDSVMFAPLLSAPRGKDQMTAEDFGRLLEQMGRCAELFRAAARQGRLLPFANAIGLLKRIHHYSREEYPCGAGGGYLAASADGDLFACHRFVDDEAAYLGNLTEGVRPERQAAWLDARNLGEQTPCGSCWARHLCAGSCHYEVLKIGRPACGYIRGWAERCLELYAELARDHPEFLQLAIAHA